jgi:hypothetical protein
MEEEISVWTKLAGLFIGWTYLEFYGADGVPTETGQWFFTHTGALKTWRYTHDVDTADRCVVLRNDQVESFLDGWHQGLYVRRDVPTFDEQS